MTIWFATVLLALPLQANAQQGIGDAARGLTILQDTEQEEAEFLPDSPTTEFELPPIEPIGSSGNLATAPQVFVRAIEVRGSTVLTGQIKQIAAEYIDRDVRTSDLQNLRYRLSRLYLDNGYVNSGVVIPDQKVSDGEIVFQAIEGQLPEITVKTDGRLRAGYVRNRIARAANAPLNVNRLRAELQLLQQDPLIGSLQSRLEPAGEPGQSLLEVEVTEQRPWNVALTVANNRSPSIGSVRTEAAFSHINVSGHADRLDLKYGQTEGLDDFAFSYAVPINARGTRIGLRWRDSDSSVVEEPFNAINIASVSSDLSLTLVQPIVRSLLRSLTLDFSLEKRRSATSLLDRPFSFSPGVVDGRSRVTAFRTGVNWIRRSQEQVVAVRGILSAGIDAWNPNKSASQPDGEFLKLLGQLQWARRFGANHNQLVLRSDFQLSNDALLPLERFAVGGGNSVRGYRENQLVRDNGFVLSAEFRVPVWQQGPGQKSVYLFAEHGRAWNEELNIEPDSIGSLGLGFRWDHPSGVSADLAFARPLRNIETAESDLQDDGVHFRIGYSIP